MCILWDSWGTTILHLLEIDNFAEGLFIDNNYHKTYSICTDVLSDITDSLPQQCNNVRLQYFLHLATVFLFMLTDPVHRILHTLWCHSSTSLPAQSNWTQFCLNTYHLKLNNKLRDYFYGHPYDCFPTGSNYIYIYIIYLYSSVTDASMPSLRKLHHSRGARSINGRGA